MGLYTVDVIGDCYMCAANLIKPLPNHVSATVGFAQSILQVANATLTPLGTPLRIRIGIHSGPAMSGVIGVHHLKFTLVGDTVNVASRMESTAVPNTIQLSEDAYKQLQREQLTIKSEAAEEQGLERGGFADQEMLSQASEEDGHAGHAFVRGNSAPPCSLDSMPKNRWEDSAELGGLLGSRSINERRTELAAMAELHHRQQCPATAAQALLGPVAPVPRHSSTEQAAQQCPGTAAQAPVAPEPRHGNMETAAQAQQHQCQQEPVPLHYEDEHKHEVPLQQQQPQQQQGCHLQPWVHRRNGQDQLQQPQSIP
ncbi:nucleotide cyclase [Dunaliella salina]|uniref:Nucleotide cyclase n=1 Tax=Dunaliella salina TaxID=3046 RepID=A0ABQ7FWF6_DUNSA|nr:nucleotide cyclase [Dunaliella salina]|eukprot:KAF5826699.1 nucleotide cyclase [Dunaliella salina]